MTAGPETRGLPARVRALEERLARQEAALVRERDAYAAAARAADAPAPPDAAMLATAQDAYDATLRELRALQSMARRLREWDLTPADTVSWAAAARALGLRADGGAHRAVRSHDASLHVLLHRCALRPHCALDGVTYAD